MNQPIQQRDVHPIRKARQAKRWTQQQLADRLGVTKATVSNWETGQDRPGADKAMRLVEIFGARLLSFGAIYRAGATRRVA